MSEITTTEEVLDEEEDKESSKIMETLEISGLCRKEKRKMAKKLKRKHMRKEMALKQHEEEEARSNDPEEQQRLRLKDQEEAEIMERQRKEFEEREKLWIEKVTKMAEEESQRKLLEEQLHQKQIENENELNEDDAWDYVEEGPAEIIWQGNEIIVKKKRVRVPKGHADQQPCNEAADRPTSNPLPPQSEAFTSYKNTSSVSAKQVFESVSQQTPNFGTEQDKAHCPFHIKTGACRFGSRCSRVHLYPDKSCTLLIKNMYNGPGLASEQDEQLEITCEFVGVTRWKVAICGEYMKSRLKQTCSRGTACNFIHCFRNPGGDYEWADCDNPPPKYWLKKMAALFGTSDEHGYDQHMGQEGRGQLRNSRKKITANDGYYSRRYRSKDDDCLDGSFGGDYSDENRSQRSSRSSRQIRSNMSSKKRSSLDEHKRYQENSDSENGQYDGKNQASDHGSDARDRDKHKSHSRRRSSRQRKVEDIPDNHRNLKDKYSSDECERYEERERLGGHDSSRKHSKRHRFESKNQSSRRDISTRQMEADFLDEHMKSDENYNSDSPRWDDGRHKRHKTNSGSNYDGKIDECDRWETGTTFSDENKRSRRNYNFDDHELYDGRYNSHDQSSSAHYKE